MVQDSEYVELLPKTFLVDEAYVIGSEDIGELMTIPTKSQDIGALASHFSQFVSKSTGHPHRVDGFDTTFYKIHNGSGTVNFVVRIRDTNEKKGEKTLIAVIQRDFGCGYKGVIRAYLQEIKPPPK